MENSDWFYNSNLKLMWAYNAYAFDHIKDAFGNLGSRHDTNPL
jgi:hypothetical protein